MNVLFISNFLFWCLIINFAILLWWFAAFVFLHSWMFRLHSRWFRLSEDRFNSIHYMGMAIYKIGILLFILVPYIALHIVTSHGG